MQEYDLPFEFYKPCPACQGYGWVNLEIHSLEELKYWARRLGQEEAFYGHNYCNKCSGGGYILDYKLPELELE